MLPPGQSVPIPLVLVQVLPRRGLSRCLCPSRLCQRAEQVCPGAGPAQQRVSDVTWSAGEWHGGCQGHIAEVHTALSPCLFQLTVALHNVPDLSAGVSCAFGDVTETEAVLVASGELRCPSPSLQELQALTRGHGQWAGGWAR